MKRFILLILFCVPLRIFSMKKQDLKQLSVDQLYDMLDELELQIVTQEDGRVDELRNEQAKIMLIIAEREESNAPSPQRSQAAGPAGFEEPNLQSFKCPYCKYSMPYEHLRFHITQRHHGQPAHICSMCRKKFTTNSHLSRHIRQVHKNSSLYTCPKCSKIFISTRQLRNHTIQKHPCSA